MEKAKSEQTKNSEQHKILFGKYLFWRKIKSITKLNLYVLNTIYNT